MADDIPGKRKIIFHTFRAFRAFRAFQAFRTFQMFREKNRCPGPPRPSG